MSNLEIVPEGRSISPRLSIKSDSLDVGPIELKMRQVLSRLKGSQYPDHFDWSVYDKIAARFGDTPPRGGVIYNTAFKLVNSNAACSKCHYSFEIDAYGRGCIHNCHYCYAKEQLYPHKYWNEPTPFPLNLAEVRKIFYTVFETDKTSKWRSIMEQKTPLRIGSMSDSFMWMDQKYGVARELLRILRFYKYPSIIFTRSDLIAEDEYISELDPALCAIQFSISGGNEKLTKQLEPGAPSVSRRLAALRKLSEAGIWTTVRINPLFPMYPDGYFSDPFKVKQRFGSMDAVPKFELFDWDFIAELKDAKVPSLVAGFVRLSSWSINNITKVTGVNFKDFFKPDSYLGNEDRKYSDSEIAFYYKKIQSLCVKHGIRFNTCYIGNGLKDYFQYQNLWTNKKDCCDVRGKVASFINSSQDISWSERLRHTNYADKALAAKEQDLKFSTEFAAKLGASIRTSPNESVEEHV